MKKSIIALIVAGAVLHTGLLGLYVYKFAFPLLMTVVCMSSAGGEELLYTSESPDGEIKLDVYRHNGGATTAFSIKVYRTDGLRKKLIYNQYRESNVTISWISNDVVKIGEVTLDLSENETYDWRD